LVTERPKSQIPLRKDSSTTTSWEFVLDRLENPEVPRTYWLASVRADGGPHLMPLLAFWIDGALHIVVAESTQKARNLLADGRCVVATGSTKLPSLDIVVEGEAAPVEDEATVRRIAAELGSHNWPLEVRGTRVYGQHAPTAGPPPYTIFRIEPTRIYGLPGMFGMDEFDPGDLPKPTRWDF